VQGVVVTYSRQAPLLGEFFYFYLLIVSFYIGSTNNYFMKPSDEKTKLTLYALSVIINDSRQIYSNNFEGVSQMKY